MPGPIKAGFICLMVTALLLTGCGKAQTKTAGDTKGITGPTIEKIQKRGKLFVGAKHDVPKFGFEDEATGKVDGYEIDLIRIITKAILGDETKYETVHVTPATRLELLNQGAVDMISATFTITEERKKQVDFTSPYFTDGIGLLVPKSSGIQDLKDLNGKTIGFLKGSTTINGLTEAAKGLGITFKTAEFETYPGTKAALQAQQVQAMSSDGAILAGYTDSEYLLLPVRYNPQPYGIATKKGSDDLQKLVEAIVTDLEKSGELKKLQSKWGIATK